MNAIKGQYAKLFIQENGLIRSPDGFLIAKLTDDWKFEDLFDKDLLQELSTKDTVD